MTKTALIINSHSNSGQQFLDGFSDFSQEKGVQNWTLFDVNDPNLLEETFREVRALQPELIVVGGGDGTVSATFNALQDLKCQFAVLPLGTSNVFARSLEMPMSPGECVDIILKGKTRPITLGKVNDRIFVSLATIGFTVSVSENVSDETKGRFGRLGYVLSGTWHGLRHRPFRAVIKTLNGKERVTTHQLLIANSQIAFPSDVTFGANIFEPKVGIISYANHQRKFPHFRAMISTLFRRRPAAGVLKISTAYAEIYTHRSRKVALDGEPFTETPITVSVIKDALDVIVP